MKKCFPGGYITWNVLTASTHIINLKGEPSVEMGPDINLNN